MDNFAITIDIDWALEPYLRLVNEYLINKRANVTWFITHNSPQVANIIKEKNYEIGIHPNFHKDTTQGDSPENIIKALRAMTNNSTLMRTHRLIQSTELLWLSGKCGIETDISLFMPGCTGLKSHTFYWGGEKIKRFPYIWEDDYQFNNPFPVYDVDKLLHDNGLIIVDFHPKHIIEHKETQGFFKKLVETGKSVKISELRD